MKKIASAVLEFDPNRNPISDDKKLSDGLSVALQLGNDLWVANDETTTLERLTLQAPLADGSVKYGDHRQFSLQDYIQLPNLPSDKNKQVQEADIEGLDYADGYLWLVGSHSKVRSKPDKDKPKDDPDKLVQINHEELAEVKTPGNRMILAWIPLNKERNTLEKESEKDGKNLTPAWLRVEGEENDWDNEFTRAFATDEHLAPFARIPGKDNGLDIEGLAVAGERVFVGLRGPVLRRHALILELEPEANGSELTLKNIGPDDSPFRKHFVDLGGLGIRDLCIRDNDMLILAGPTMELDAPYKIFKWKDGAKPKERSLVRNGELDSVVEISQSGANGFAEGMTIFKRGDGEPDSILVVYDAAEGRTEGATIRGDIFGPLF